MTSMSRLATVIAGGLLFAAGWVSPAQAASYCSFSGHVVRATIPEGHVVRLMAFPNGTLHYVDNSDSSREARCGRATVKNTAKVRIRGRGSSSRLIYVQEYGPFAPGRGDEKGIREIEFVLDGVTSLWLQGRDAADTITLGRTGINVTGDGDADLRGVEGLDDVTVFARGGADVLTGRGGHGTGEQWPRRRGLVLLGDDGADTVTGRSGRDVLDGGIGVDTLKGGRGADDLTGGDSANASQPTGNTIRGGRGADVIRGSFFPDRLFGGPGDDYLEANHLDRDLAVDGGAGHDLARVDDDPRDPRVRIEEFLGS